jgi:hypothetical protein
MESSAPLERCGVSCWWEAKVPEIIGYVKDQLPELREWVKVQPVSNLLQIRCAVGRSECWYGLGIDVATHLTLVRGLDDPKVKALGGQFLPNWNSAILFKYPKGVKISPHRDPACFEDWAVMVNVGEAEFIEYADGGKVITNLEDGVVIRFNTQITHGIKPVHLTRYSLLFRKIKQAHLALALSLPYHLNHT